MNRLALLACSIYVVIPAVVGMVSIGGLVFGDVNPESSRGLMLGAFFGGFFGIPLAVLQALAVFRRSSIAAKLVSCVYWFWFIILSIGIVQVLVLGSDDEAPFKFWPDATVLTAIVLMNLFAAIYMWKYAATLQGQLR
jgi:hypothetical protein